MLATPQLTDSSLTLDSGIALLQFERHDVRNALTGTALVDDIVLTCEWVNKNHDIAVLVITGQGSAFSSGGNVRDMASKSGDFEGDVQTLEQRYRQGIQRMPLAISQLEVPVIAAINGPAIGAGFDLANMCDMRIASSRAKFGETFINLGLIPGDGGAWFMQRLIGYQKAAELTFTGKIIDAQTAQTYGIVMDVVEPDALMSTTMALAKEIASKPKQATRLTKRLMKLAQKSELPEFLEVCAVYQGMCHQNPEHLAAVNAMLAQMNKS
ncbi:enoyl-CoA hydratase-related protein [Thalassotalea ganghwensis]